MVDAPPPSAVQALYPNRAAEFAKRDVRRAAREE